MLEPIFEGSILTFMLRRTCNIRLRSYARARAHTYTHAHMHTRTHTHMHTQGLCNRWLCINWLCSSLAVLHVPHVSVLNRASPVLLWHPSIRLIHYRSLSFSASGNLTMSTYVHVRTRVCSTGSGCRVLPASCTLCQVSSDPLGQIRPNAPATQLTRTARIALPQSQARCALRSPTKTIVCILRAMPMLHMHLVRVPPDCPCRGTMASTIGTLPRACGSRLRRPPVFLLTRSRDSLFTPCMIVA